MAQEKEIKVLLNIPQSEFLARAIKHGYQCQGTVKQTDIYFDTNDWYLYRNVASLRIRLVNELEHSFTFKKVYCTPAKNEKYYIEEIEIPFPIRQNDDFKQIFLRLKLPLPEAVQYNAQELTRALKSAGFQDEQHLQKQRTEYIYEDCQLTIDEVDKVGTIIEFECKTSDPNDLIADLLNTAEWQRNLIGTGYLWLEKVKGLTAHLHSFEKFGINPRWNVWENENDFYLDISKSDKQLRANNKG